MTARPILLVPLLFLMAVAARAAEVEVYTLEHRTAAELVPMLQPMIEGKVSGQGNKVFVRAEKKEQAAAKELLEELDTPPERLRISVRQSARSHDAGVGGSASGRVETDADGEVRGEAQARVYGTPGLDRDDTIQHVQVMEGSWARIEVGRAVPVAYRRTTGDTVESGVEHVRATRGFQVRARLIGDDVSLEIHPFTVSEADEGGGRFEVRDLVTTLRGPTGAWMELGGQHETLSGERRGTVYSTREISEQNYLTLIRVERLSGK